MEPIILKEYPFVGITGTIYYPHFGYNKWYLVTHANPISFYQLVYLCHIPDDEALILKLKYGTGIVLQTAEQML
jgi:hypothetical protein